MYAAFLLEAQGFLPKLAQINAASRIQESTAMWTELAHTFKSIFTNTSPSEFEKAALLLRQIHQIESKLIHDSTNVTERIIK